MAKDEIEKISELLDNLKADKYPLETYGYIGKRGVRRQDGYEKASGRAVYTIDLQLPGMLYAKFLTCPYPHARIKTMDTSKAAALPGVRAILRYDDQSCPPLRTWEAMSRMRYPYCPRWLTSRGKRLERLWRRIQKALQMKRSDSSRWNGRNVLSSLIWRRL
jgi:hypothetical protein